MSKWIGVFSSVTLLAIFLVASSAARAQVVPGSVMVGVDVGYLHTSIADFSESGTTSSWNRYTVGATGGYNVDQWIGAFFEYNYDSIFSNQADFDGLSAHANNYGGAARFYLLPKSKIVPYGVFDVGGATTVFSESGESLSYNGYYIGGGGGVAYYLTKNLGAAGDLRFNRYSFNISGDDASITVNPHLVTVVGGVFYQFGGTKKAK